MSESNYNSTPKSTTGMPSGIPYIIGNEAAERFSFYGMKTILIVFMTKYMLDSSGGFDVMSEENAKAWYHSFSSAVYFFPILGAIISDAFLGKYKTILSLSIVYCLGHLALALDETRMGLGIGLTLIAIGSGGIKPCVSAHVGDQFGPKNAHLLEKVFEWFYFSINLGAFASTLATPWLLEHYGPSLAFGIPGALMLIATIVFWMGRNTFIHIPKHGAGFVKEVFSGEGLKVIGRLSVLYAFVAMFWALFDQTGSAWVLQADKMDLHVFGVELLPSQIQAANPLLIMLFIPLFSFGLYPAINKIFPLNPLRKIGIGFFITTIAFLIPAWIEIQIADGATPSIGWQLLAYIIITAAEVFVSITCLEFSYTQAPKKMKSFIMGIFLMSVSLGNLFTSGVNFFIQDEAVVAEDLAGEGTTKASLEKSTKFELICEGGGDTVDSSRTPVDVAVPSPGKDAKAAGEKKAVEISTFTLNKEDTGLLILTPGKDVTFEWATKNAKSCKISPDGSPVETSGTKTVKPEDTTTYVFSCEGNEGFEGAEKRVKVVVTEGVTITSFSADQSRLDPPGGEVNLSWKADKAERCKIVAHTSTLSGSGYYFFFAGAMFVTALGFVVFSRTFKMQSHIQGEEDRE